MNFELSTILRANTSGLNSITSAQIVSWLGCNLREKNQPAAEVPPSPAKIEDTKLPSIQSDIHHTTDLGWDKRCAISGHNRGAGVPP